MRELESYDVDGVRGLQQIIISLCRLWRLGVVYGFIRII